MLAIKPRMKVTLRLLLIATVLFNAIAPTLTAKANSLSEEKGLRVSVSQKTYFWQIVDRARALLKQITIFDAQPESSILDQLDSPTETPTPSPTGTPTPTSSPQPTYTQSAASVSFASFNDSYGLDSNDVYSYGGVYNNGFIINYDLTSVNRGIWGDPYWYVHLVIRFTTSGSAAGVYVRNDAEANGTFFYTGQPNVLAVDAQPYPADTWALGNRPNRYGLGHVVADGLDGFHDGWVVIDLAAEENSSASFKGTLYFQPQPVFPTPIPATLTPTPTFTPTATPTPDWSTDVYPGSILNACKNKSPQLTTILTGE